MAGILDGIRILDVTYGLAGAMATQLLADMGAGILRIDHPGATRSVDDLVRLRGRRSIAVDMTREEGQTLARRLVDSTDVLLTMARRDGEEPFSNYAALSGRNPRLIHCRLTAMPMHDGAESRAWVEDHLIAARYGVYDQPGWREGPTFVTGNVPSLGAALLAVQAIGSALYVREREGAGQQVDVSLYAGALALQPTIMRASVDAPGSDTPPPPRRPHGSAPFYSLYECADGEWLHLGCLSPAFQRNAIAALNLQADLEALGFGRPEGRENLATIIELVASCMKQRPYAEWAAIFEAADVPHARSQPTEDLLDDPQVHSQGLLVTVDDPTVGRMQQMGTTLTFAGYAESAPAPAPLIGQHTDQVLHELGVSDADILRLRESGVVA